MERVGLKQFPRKAKQGFMFLIVAWAFLILSQAVLYGTISLVQLTLGSFCCIVVYSLKNWGRIFSALYNFVIIGNCLYSLSCLILEEIPHFIPYGIQAVNIVLFAIATYLLLHKETSRFFKSRLRTPVPGPGKGVEANL